MIDVCCSGLHTKQQAQSWRSLRRIALYFGSRDGLNLHGPSAQQQQEEELSETTGSLSLRPPLQFSEVAGYKHAKAQLCFIFNMQLGLDSLKGLKCWWLLNFPRYGTLWINFLVWRKQYSRLPHRWDADARACMARSAASCHLEKSRAWAFTLLRLDFLVALDLTQITSLIFHPTCLTCRTHWNRCSSRHMGE